MIIPNHVKIILWDVDTRTLDIKRDNRYIITRVAEKGAWSDVCWLKETYGIKKIKEAVAASRNTSVKTKNFWQLF